MNMMSLKQENINIETTSSFSKMFMKCITYKIYLEETLIWVDSISEEEQILIQIITSSLSAWGSTLADPRTSAFVLHYSHTLAPLK